MSTEASSTEVQIAMFTPALDLAAQGPLHEVADRGACRKLAARGSREEVIDALSRFVDALQSARDGTYLIKVFVHDRELGLPVVEPAR